MIDTDIVERLRYAAEEARKDAIMENFSVSENLLKDAAGEIERLRKVLKFIAYDYVELSHEKAVDQRNFHMRLARQTYIDSYLKQEYDKPRVKIDDNF